MRPTACLKFALPDGHPQWTLGNRGLYYSVSGTGRVIHCVSEI